jgi:hypothetical protein
MADRPDPRTVVVSIRFTPAEAAHLDAAGRVLSQPRGRADFCRAASLSAAKARVPAPAPLRRPPRRKPTADIRALGQILAALGKIGGHSNQLAKIANAKAAVPTVQAIGALTAEIGAVRQAVAAALSGGEEQDGAAGT